MLLLTHLHLSILFIRVTHSGIVHGPNTLMSPALTAVVVEALLFLFFSIGYVESDFSA
jgi:hypothetical protein